MLTIHLETVDSTQTYARARSPSFDPLEITCVAAEEQTAGRGRLNRKWVSPKGVNLYATFYFQLPSSQLHLSSLAQVMTYSFASLLIDEGLAPQIKWPNDVLLHGKKLSGSLCETSVLGENVEVFLGIGINVNMENLSEIDQPATSLKRETGETWDRKALLQNLQKRFESDLHAFRQKGFFPFHTPFENLLAHKGKQVRCSDGKKTWTGVCHSLATDGRLNLYLPEEQRMQTISSGDLSF